MAATGNVGPQAAGSLRDSRETSYFRETNSQVFCMSAPANVQSVAAIEKVRLALLRFGDAVEQSTMVLENEIALNLFMNHLFSEFCYVYFYSH